MSPFCYRAVVAVCAALLSSTLYAGCDFDADSADRLDFAERIVDCQEPPASPASDLSPVVIEPLYGDSAGRAVISEHRVVAPGSLNHSPGQSFEARELYSLRGDASFEESVTLAISRLHLQMAHHCSRGWRLDGQRSEALQDTRDPLRSGKYYLYYQFSCVAR